MKYAITAITLALSTQAFAADNIYEGRGNIYKTHATLADLQSEATRLNTYNNGNSVAIKIHDGQIKDLQQNKADKSEVAAVNSRVDHTNKQVAANTKETVRLENVKADKSALKATDGKVAQQGTQINQNTTVINQHSSTLNEYGSKLDSYGTAHDNLASSMYQYQNQTDSRLNTLENDVREAKEASAVALAVAGHQFCTDLNCGVQAAVSGSTIAGKQAVAIGIGGAVSENLFFNAAFSRSGATQGGVVSATYRLR